MYMENRKAVYVSIIFCLLFSGITGIGMYKYNQRKTVSKGIVIKQLGNSGDHVENALVETSSKEETVSPTARIIMKQYYKKCGHTTENEFSVPEDIINMNRKQVEKYYFGWNIDSFSNSEIVVSKENSGLCDEHYVVKDIDGLVTVYSTDENHNEALVYSTEIETKYLSEEDIKKLEQGINIVGKENLSALLEDYE